MNSLLIQRATFDDLEKILELQKTAFLSEAELYNDYSLEPLTQTLDSIRNEFKHSIFLKALYQNEIVGSVRGKYEAGKYLVGRLVVSPSFRRQGIGRKLMRALEEECREAKDFFLFTGSKSVRNIALYESLGYEKYEEQENKNKPGLVIVRMCKRKIG
ncbi:MAG: GNAT family N-acetyltransferase [Candidatus Azobacteroides sp.]|nr:GNAT family N-acetyltransferase [Candidatus Azobacteroides sp.]